jgi:hypothetical protein
MRGMTQEEYVVLLRGDSESAKSDAGKRLFQVSERLTERGCLARGQIGIDLVYNRTELGEIAMKLGPQILCDSGPGAGE